MTIKKFIVFILILCLLGNILSNRYIRHYPVHSRKVTYNYSESVKVERKRQIEVPFPVGE